MKYQLKGITWLKLNINRRADLDSERGAITVAETLIALGVGATVLAVVFAGIPAVVDARNTSAAVSGITQIASSVRTTFGVRNDFTGLDTDLARNLSGFPPNFKTESGAIHPWGGDVEIASGSGATFTIKFEDLNAGPCSSLATTTLDLASEIMIGATVVDLTAVDDPSTDNDNEGLPADIAELCSTNSPGDVIWTFQG